MGESMRSESSTGVLMLFSAGTFLYVATVHVLPELVGFIICFEQKVEFSYLFRVRLSMKIKENEFRNPIIDYIRKKVHEDVTF